MVAPRPLGHWRTFQNVGPALTVGGKDRNSLGVNSDDGIVRQAIAERFESNRERGSDKTRRNRQVHGTSDISGRAWLGDHVKAAVSVAGLYTSHHLHQIFHGERPAGAATGFDMSTKAMLAVDNHGRMILPHNKREKGPTHPLAGREDIGKIGDKPEQHGPLKRGRNKGDESRGLRHGKGHQAVTSRLLEKRLQRIRKFHGHTS